jgi:hypothetical protein
MTTPQPYAAVHRYSFGGGGGGENVLLFPISHGLDQKGCKEAAVTIDVTQQEISGYINMKGSCGERGPNVTIFTFFSFFFFDWCF